MTNEQKKSRGRPKKRPETVAQWLKSDLIPSQTEIQKFLNTNNDTMKTELLRLDGHHEISKRKLLEQYNIPYGIVGNPVSRVKQIQQLENAVRQGDKRAVTRIKEIEKCVKEWEKLLNSQEDARERTKKPYGEQRAKIIIIQQRLKDSMIAINKANEDAKKTTYEHVHGVEMRVRSLESDRTQMRNHHLSVARVEWTHSKVKELEQELFKIKEVLRQASIIGIDYK